MTDRLKKAPTKDEYEYVHWLDVFYWENDGRFPAPELAAQILKWDVEKIKKLNESKTVKYMCRNRGIEIKVIKTNDLIPEQVAAANTYLNIADDRPIAQKLNELGINPARFWGWMQGKAFKEYMMNRAEELFQTGMPMVHRELMAKAMKGDLKAITLYYRISGRFTGIDSIEAQNFTIMTQRLIEAIQIEVQDPEVIERIAKRFQAIGAGEPINTFTGQPATSFNKPEEVKTRVIVHKPETLGNSI